MALIIDATTGTVLDMSDCFILDDGNLTPEEEAMLDSGSDSLVGELARNEGVPLTEEALEWIKYGRKTSVSYGPSALRDEAQVLLEVLDPDDVEDIATRGLIERFMQAKDDEVAMIGEHILNDDAVWNGYKNNFIEALHSFYGREPF